MKDFWNFKHNPSYSWNTFIQTELPPHKLRSSHKCMITSINLIIFLWTVFQFQTWLYCCAIIHFRLYTLKLLKTVVCSNPELSKPAFENVYPMFEATDLLSDIRLWSWLAILWWNNLASSGCRICSASWGSMMIESGIVGRMLIYWRAIDML